MLLYFFKNRIISFVKLFLQIEVKAYCCIDTVIEIQGQIHRDKRWNNLVYRYRSKPLPRTRNECVLWGPVATPVTRGLLCILECHPRVAILVPGQLRLQTYRAVRTGRAQPARHSRYFVQSRDLCLGIRYCAPCMETWRSDWIVWDVSGSPLSLVIVTWVANPPLITAHWLDPS